MNQRSNLDTSLYIPSASTQSPSAPVPHTCSKRVLLGSTQQNHKEPHHIACEL